jgi:hypothetical protein
MPTRRNRTEAITTDRGSPCALGTITAEQAIAEIREFYSVLPSDEARTGPGVSPQFNPRRCAQATEFKP